MVPRRPLVDISQVFGLNFANNVDQTSGWGHRRVGGGPGATCVAVAGLGSQAWRWRAWGHLRGDLRL